MVIVVKNGEGKINECLRSVFNQNYPSTNFEVIVVDGGSTDRTVSIVQEFPVHLIIDYNGTIAHGRNIGVQSSIGEYIAFTDSDCVVGKDWLRSLAFELQNNAEVIAVGGPNVVNNSDAPLAKAIGHMQETFIGSGGSPQSYALKDPKYVYSLANCNAMYRKKILLAENFDNKLNVGEDCELNYRLSRKGYLFRYLPYAVVWHQRPKSFKAFFRKMFSYGDAMAKVIKKHKRMVRWFAPIPSIALFALFIGVLSVSMFPVMAYITLAALFFYTAILIGSTIKVYSKYPCGASFWVILLLPVQHLAYAFGFVNGILRR